MLKRSLIVIALALAAAVAAQAQKASVDVPGIKGTAAYADVLLRKTEVQADLEAFGQDYTDASPKMLDLRVELASLERSSERILAVKAAQADRLTDALGKMMVKKAALDAELAHLNRTYAKEHPDVRRAQRRADLFAAAIEDILK